MLRSVVGLGVAAALALGSQARAATVSFTLTSAPPPLGAYANVGPNSGDLFQDLTVTPFDVALGDLTGVTIQAKANGNGFIQAIPLPIPPGVPSPPLNDGFLSLIATSRLSAPLPLTLGTTMAFAHAAGLSFLGDAASYSFDTTTVLTAPTSLAAFLSSAPALTLTDSLAYGASYTNVNLAASNFGFSTAFTTVVTYDYTPASVGPTPDGVPEPAQWSLMLLGLASMGGSLRHRRTARQSGLRTRLPWAAG